MSKTHQLKTISLGEAMTSPSRSRHATGFTLIELMVVMVIIGLLIGIAVPNFQGAQERAKDASVKANMHGVQLGVERYASDHYGNYPPGVVSDSFSWPVYMPTSLKNPFNPNERNILLMDDDVGTSTTAATVAAAASAALSASGHMQFYVDTANKSSYAITGADKDKRPLRDASGAIYLLRN